MVASVIHKMEIAGGASLCSNGCTRPTTVGWPLSSLKHAVDRVADFGKTASLLACIAIWNFDPPASTDTKEECCLTFLTQLAAMLSRGCGALEESSQ